MLDIYVECATQVAAMPVVPGRKSAAESFAGAVSTYTIEAMMSDGRALQVCLTTSWITQGDGQACAMFHVGILCGLHVRS